MSDVTEALKIAKAEVTRLRTLRRVPICHACGHFELRLMRWSNDVPNPRGYIDAGSVCSTCSPQDRSIVPNYASLEEALAAK